MADDEVYLWTYYAQWVDVPVNDQFGNRIDFMYRGAAIEEKKGPTWIPINQKLKADGTYRDPVFSYTSKSTLPRVVKRGSPEAVAWLTAAPEPISVGVDPQDFEVKVGGHLLITGVAGRKMIAQAPNIVTVEWPD